MDEAIQSLLRGIPSMHDLLEDDSIILLMREYGDELVKLELRELIESLRNNIKSGTEIEIDRIKLFNDLTRRVRSFAADEERVVINATGILLHTGLGRAALAQEAISAITAASGYTPIQTDIDTGQRSLREAKIERILCELTGCEAATVVNNNAAATMLVLNTLCNNKEAIISRGQLVEIGGAFRMPDVMDKSSAIMHEIGTTNRTHLKDYAAAINENSGALVHVHTSNYRIRGFNNSPDISELAPLAKEQNLYSIDDLGSGALSTLDEWGLPNEPLIKDSIKAGADVCCFSGDKLIGGPQCGIICGKKEVIEAIRKNPFARMFRVCKLTLAALEATMVIWLNDTFRGKIPFYQMLSTPLQTLLERAGKIVDELSDIFEIECSFNESGAYVGSGSIPDEAIPSVAVRIIHKSIKPHKLALALRQHGVFPRVSDNALWLDMITLLAGQDEIIGDKIRKAISELKQD